MKLLRALLLLTIIPIGILVWRELATQSLLLDIGVTIGEEQIRETLLEVNLGEVTEVPVNGAYLVTVLCSITENDRIELQFKRYGLEGENVNLAAEATIQTVDRRKAFYRVSGTLPVESNWSITVTPRFL